MQVVIENKYQHLELTSGDTFTEYFYQLCQFKKPLEIKECFMNEKIKDKITKEVISYGLMGAARTSKIANAKILLECAKEYKNIKNEEIAFNSAINLAIKVGFIQFANELIELTNCLSWETQSIINRSQKDYGLQKSIFSGKNFGIIGSKYEKFSPSIFKMQSQQKENLELLLQHSVHINHIKNLVQESIENNNIIPLIAIIKSKYLEQVLEDNDFKICMNNTNNKEIKQEFQNLINNALLEKKLNNNLSLKNSKTEKYKI